jgi:carbonic anhydrase
MNTKLSFLYALLLSLVSFAQAANLPVSKSEQLGMTADEALSNLMDGNHRYAKGNLTAPNIKARIDVAAKGQYPKAYVLSCVDSRVPVEMVFDQGIGDIFVGRVAGNVENEDQIGSMEFATKYAGAKLIMVLGHESCGAVKGACAGVEDGNLTLLLEKISPAIHSVVGYKQEERIVENKKFLDEVIESNVERTIKDIRSRSAILSEMEAKGEIKIVGGVYSLKTGLVKLTEK